jgi:lathosterol oxidase
LTDDSHTPPISAGESKVWNYHPDLPIPTSPVFAWPPRPVAAFKWLSVYWLAISMIVIELALAYVVFAWLQPGPEQTSTLSLGWIARIYLRNLALVFLFAGGLHLYLYSFSKQGKVLKFDARSMARDNGTYSFRDQVLDNMFWTCASGVTIWSTYEVLYVWASTNGYAPGLTWSANPVWFALMFPLIPIWSSFHFYWIHRALHWPPLYRLAHSLHHRNVNIGPWTGTSMHPIEAPNVFLQLPDPLRCRLVPDPLPVPRLRPGAGPARLAFRIRRSAGKGRETA